MEEYVWISKLNQNPVFKEHVHPVLQKLAFEYGVKISISGAKDTSDEAYIQAVYDAIEHKVAGIMIVGWQGKQNVQAVNDAIANGIPVITVDSDISQSQRLAHVGTDWFRMGQAMAQSLAKMINGTGKILMLGMSGLENMEKGFRGFSQTLRGYPDLQLLGPEDDFAEGPERAEQIVTEYAKKYPDLAGIAAFDGNGGPGAAVALKKLLKIKTVHLVCVDVNKLQLQHLRDGAIDACFAQQREYFTYLAFQMLYSYNHGSIGTGYKSGAVNIPGNIATDFQVVTKKNTNTFKRTFDIEEALNRHHLVQQVNLLTQMVKNVSEIIITTDLEGNIIYANPYAKDLLSYGDDILELNVNNVFESLQKRIDIDKEFLIEDNLITEETLAFKSSGDNVPVQLTIAPLTTEKGISGLVLIAIDITERKKSAIEISNKEATLRSIYRAAPVGIGLVSNRIIKWTNDRIAVMLGYSKEEIAGQSARFLYLSQDEFDRVGREKYQQIAEKGIGTVETKWQCKDGTVLDVLLSSSYVDSSDPEQGAIFTATDITKAKGIKKTLDLSDAKFRDLVQMAPDWIWEIDCQGRYTFVGPQSRELLGYEPEDFIGKTPFDFMPEDDAEKVKKVFQKIQERQDTFFHLENICLHKNGRRILMETSGVPFFNPGGEILGYRGIDRDVTQRPVSERELWKACQVSRDIINSIPAGLFVYKYEAPDRLILLEGNPEAVRLTGKKLVDWKDKEFNEIWPQAKELGITEKFLEAAATDEPKEFPSLYYKDNTLDCYFRTIIFPITESKIGVSFEDITIAKMAEQSVERERDKVHDYLDIAGVIFVALDALGNVTLINKKGCEVLGYSEHEILNKNWFDNFVPEKLRKNISSTFKELISGNLENVEHYENPVCSRSGEERLIAWHNQLLFDSNDKLVGTLSSGDDITESRKMQDALVDSEQHFRAVFEQAAVGFVHTDLEGNFLDVNQKFCEIIGYSREEMLARNFRDITHPEDLEKDLAFYNKTLAGELRTYAIEKRYICKDNSVVWVNVSVSLVRDGNKNPKNCIGVVEEISQRKKYEKRVADLAKFPEQNPHPVLRIQRDGNIQYANHAGKVLLKKWNSQVGEQAPLDLSTYLNNAFNTQLTQIMELGYEGKVFSLTFVPVVPSDYANVFGRDITEARKLQDQEKRLIAQAVAADMERRKASELRRAYEKLQILQTQLLTAEKLSGVGQLAAGVAHELNSPLAGLLSLLRTYQKRSQENPDDLDLVTSMLEAAKHMAKIVGDLTSFARESKGELEELDLNTVIDATLSFAGYHLNKNQIELKKDLCENLKKIQADKSQMQQVLLNLITNARDAMPTGGVFTISTSNDEDGMVSLKCSDTGAGIPDEDISKIFDPFFTTKDQGKGVGLGLSISHGIIENHKGKIKVHTEKDYGTTFNVLLPAKG